MYAKGLLLSGGDEGRIKVWNILNGFNRATFNAHKGEVNCIIHLQDTVGKNQHSLVASGGSDGRIIVFNLDSDEKVREIEGHIGGVMSLAYDL